MTKILMKSTAILALIFSVALTGCQQKGTDTAELKTDSVKFDSKDTTLHVLYNVQFIQNGNEALRNSFAEYVNETLGDRYNGALDNIDTLVTFYGKSTYDSMLVQKKELGSDMANFGLESTNTINKIYENDKLVTFVNEGYNYQGGAHGMSWKMGQTFRKSDGRRFGAEMLKNTFDEGFTDLVKSGLKEYFSKYSETKVVTDEDLENQLLDVKVYNIPLPQCPPYFTKDGVTFVYQQYEIACYAAGMPTFTVPYSKIKPYLIRAARELVEK